MAMDGLSLHAMLWEIRGLLGARVDKVQQPDKDTLLLSCHGSDCGRVKLLVNIHNENGRIALTRDTAENPAAAPAFCMLLRKRLIGSRITKMEQTGLDRTVRFRFSGRDELMDEAVCSLVVELLGKHGNAFLLDENDVILDCLRHIGVGAEALRVCLPNVKYESLPLQEKRDPLSASLEELAAVDSPCSLMNGYMGVSRQIATLLLPESLSAEQRGPYLFDTLQGLKEGKLSPCLVPGMGPAPFRPLDRSDTMSFPTLSECYDAWYRERDVRIRMLRETGSLRATLEHALKRCENKISTFTGDLMSAEEEGRLRLCGELLLSFHGDRPKGADSVVVENYYEFPPVKVTVRLDPALSVAENAARYFKRYQKLKAARAYAEGEMGKLKEEQLYLQGQLVALNACENGDDVAEIRQELIRERYIRPTPVKGTARPKASRSMPLHFLSSTGLSIFVGKNNEQNDRLTRNAPADALWLHVKDAAGSHVIVDSKGMPDQQTLLEAANLAVHFSSQRNGASVPVDYVPRRYVKKPSGSKPGFVLFTNQRTVFITPDPNLISTLKKGVKEY
ncbi:MAG: NFACT family protein [Clostridia bacterium]|nr:NFACT family protein [Clostridia bacterium]